MADNVASERKFAELECIESSRRNASERNNKQNSSEILPREHDTFSFFFFYQRDEIYLYNCEKQVECDLSRYAAALEAAAAATTTSTSTTNEDR